jgi:hypothetical protein
MRSEISTPTDEEWGDCGCPIRNPKLHDGRGLCRETDSCGFACTRVKGHGGPHRACGVSRDEDHPISEWEQTRAQGRMD